MGKSLMTEFIGTFFLVLTICLTVMSGSQFVPLAAGASLMVMVYMGGHISGGHYNPAVSLAVWLRGRLETNKVLPYIASQVAGSIAAATIAWWVMGRSIAPAPSPEHTAFHALVIEFLFTFALALVVLNAATATKTAGNSFYGLAIGFTVTVGAFAGSPISGGAFNPAVGLGTTLVQAAVGEGSVAYVWIYLVGPFLGGWVAAQVFRAQAPEDR